MITIKPGRGAGDEADPAPGIPGNPRLEAQGWQRRFLADSERAEEAVELYTSLGFEVCAEKLQPSGFAPQCGDCSLVVCRSYVLIYTRERGWSGPPCGSEAI